MALLPASDLEAIIVEADLLGSHPVLQIPLGSDLEDAALGGSQGRSRLYARASLREISKEDLLRARKNADETGRIGEELVNAHLEQLVGAGELIHVQWTSQHNAVAPFDFKVLTSAGENVLIDVKTTIGEFDRAIHISFNELLQIANGLERYDIYRVFDATLPEARLRVSHDIRGIGQGILSALALLPEGVIADSMSVRPSLLNFSPEIRIHLLDSDEGEV